MLVLFASRSVTFRGLLKDKMTGGLEGVPREVLQWLHDRNVQLTGRSIKWEMSSGLLPAQILESSFPRVGRRARTLAALISPLGGPISVTLKSKCKNWLPTVSGRVLLADDIMTGCAGMR